MLFNRHVLTIGPYRTLDPVYPVPECVSLVLKKDAIVLGYLVCEVRK